jgi:hypothetical protein
MKKWLILFLTLTMFSFGVCAGVIYEFNGKTGWDGSLFESPCCDAGYHTNYGRFLPTGDFTISAVDAIVWYHASAGNVVLTLQEFNGSTWTDITTSDPTYVDSIYLTPVQYHWTFSPPVSIVYDSGKQYRLNIDPTNSVTYYGGVNTSTPYQYPAVMRVYSPYPLTLGWPLPGNPPGTVSGYNFGDTWVEGECPTGVDKVHTGADYAASVNDNVYAAEAGVVKHIGFASGWGNSIVIEHTHPDGWKYTTVYWHVDPLVSVNDTPEKGEQIADVADISSDHLHFGVRMGGYTEINGKSISGVGALPQSNCDDYPAFPGGFIDADDALYVEFD